MKNIDSPTAVRAILSQYGVAPNKQLGQNFLFESNMLEKIVDSAGIDGMNVLEIGPGLGHLTRRLASRAKKVIAVEIDSGFVRILNDVLNGVDNVEIIHADFLKTDMDNLYERLGGDFAVCANLPYYITSPIIMRVLESDLPWSHMSILIQKEVAERISASPGNKSYGSLSIAAQYYADAEIAMKVPPNCFFPVPQVDSLLLRLTRRSELMVVKDRSLYFALVRAAFAMRRKTLVNNLMREFSISRNDALNAINECGMDSNLRGEMLSPEDFARLANVLFDILPKNGQEIVTLK